MIYILLVIIVILIALIFAIYFWTSRTLSSVDKMIDSAINNTFSETSFTEKKLSKLESKMYRYLLGGTTALKQIKTEKDSIKTLIADISHQTKTPVSNILLYSQLLNEDSELKDSTKEIVSRIEEQTEKLNFLISALIKTSRLENGIINILPKENSVNKLIKSLDFKNAACEKNIEYSENLDGEYTAEFDFKWTAEAISNIIDNAVKYTPHGGKITISAEEYEMFICINIADTGIGMSEDETAKAFTRFYRSPEVRDENGVGIGLYLTREILTKEGGYVKVSSQKGNGSVFSVFLPKNSNLSKL